MANPVIVAVAADQWVKVATNVTSGTVHTLGPTDGEWYQTYKLTGEAAPIDDPEVKLVQPSQSIDALVAIDVYIYHKSESGRVRVDL